MDYSVHESSYVEQGARIGTGTTIWHFCHVMGEARIGAHCNIGQNVYIANGVTVGDNVKVQNNVSLYTGVTVEDDVFLGPSATFTNVINPRSRVDRRGEFRETRVRRGASIGANATLLCGITLGRYCLIGAGSVVTRDVPDYALAYGNPARLHGWVCKCGARLDFHPADGHEEALCLKCGEGYRKQADIVRPAGGEAE